MCLQKSFQGYFFYKRAVIFFCLQDSSQMSSVHRELSSLMSLEELLSWVLLIMELLNILRVQERFKRFSVHKRAFKYPQLFKGILFIEELLNAAICRSASKYSLHKEEFSNILCLKNRTGILFIEQLSKFFFSNDELSKVLYLQTSIQRYSVQRTIINCVLFTIRLSKVFCLYNTLSVVFSLQKGFQRSSVFVKTLNCDLSILFKVLLLIKGLSDVFCLLRSFHSSVVYRKAGKYMLYSEELSNDFCI